MRYLLDTNTCIRYLNQRSAAVVARFHALSDSDIVVCSVVRAELYYGAIKSQVSTATMTKHRAFVERFASLGFDDKAAEYYARTRVALERAGTPIGANDLLIAAIALANDLVLVTHNTREFARIPGLKLEDWEMSNPPPTLP